MWRSRSRVSWRGLGRAWLKAMLASEPMAYGCSLMTEAAVRRADPRGHHSDR